MLQLLSESIASNSYLETTVDVKGIVLATLLFLFTSEDDKLNCLKEAAKNS